MEITIYVSNDYWGGLDQMNIDVDKLKKITKQEKKDAPVLII